MSSCCNLLSEEQFLCSICLHGFSELVSIPCGHSLCMICITKYCEIDDISQCPFCMENFYSEPELCVNSMFRHVLLDHFKKTVKKEHPDKPEEESVPSLCICTQMDPTVLESCLIPLTSDGQTHLVEPEDLLNRVEKLIDTEEKVVDTEEKEKVIDSEKEEKVMDSEEKDTLIDTEKEKVIDNEEEKVIDTEEKEKVIDTEEKDKVIDNEEEKVIVTEEKENVIDTEEKEIGVEAEEREKVIDSEKEKAIDTKEKVVDAEEKLIEVEEKVSNIEEKVIKPAKTILRICTKHWRPLEQFCKTDRTCVCFMCLTTDHKTHCAVPLEEECGETKAQLWAEEEEVQNMIQERLDKIQEIKLSVQISKKDAEREISDSVQAFTTLVRSIERSQAELIKMIEENQKAAEKKTEGFIKDLEQEIIELKRRSTDLEQLSHTEDHLQLLQTFLSLSTPPPTKDWSQIRVHSDVSVGTARRAVCKLEDTLIDVLKTLCDAELRRARQYAVDVTLDPDTAHARLRLSDDLKRVRHGYVLMELPDNPERFDPVVLVLGKQSISAGRFYYEVMVEGKTEWDLGVARRSIERKGSITVNPENGHWTIWLRNGNEYMALPEPPVLLSLREKPQKVGVFVDYEEGQVTFYDVEARSHIYSYTGCIFLETLLPYLSPCLNDRGINSAPLVITPVQKT